MLFIIIAHLYKFIKNSILNLIYFAIDILALRTADPKPDDPVEHLRDYFGRYRDPMWDVVEQLTVENEKIRQDLPDLET